MQLNNERIKDALWEVKLKKAFLDATVAIQQSGCPHSDIAECDSLHSDYFYSSPPLRICLDCGITEECWGCGFRTLYIGDKYSFQPRRISRDQLYALRIGKFIEQ